MGNVTIKKILIFCRDSQVNIQRMSAMAFLSGAPGFIFSKFPTLIGGGQDYIVSFTTYMR